MKVLLSSAAESDLEAIADHIAADSPSHALAFIRTLRAKCEDIANFPRRFPAVERYAREAVRRRVHGNYLIFYRIDADAITILRIINGAQDHDGDLD